VSEKWKKETGVGTGGVDNPKSREGFVSVPFRLYVCILQYGDPTKHADTARHTTSYSKSQYILVVSQVVAL
jgi:hypothetical protein